MFDIDATFNKIEALSTEEKTFFFMYAAHQAIGQKRKTGEGYWTHPVMVKEYVRAYCKDSTLEMRQAALLHDVVEDTKITLDNIRSMFGYKVADYVNALTKVAGDKEETNRKIIDAPADVKFIKLCDIFHNLQCVDGASASFKKQFIAKKIDQVCKCFYEKEDFTNSAVTHKEFYSLLAAVNNLLKENNV